MNKIKNAFNWIWDNALWLFAAILFIAGFINELMFNNMDAAIIDFIFAWASLLGHGQLHIMRMIEELSKSPTE